MEKNIKTFRAHRALACLYGVLMLLFALLLFMAKDPAPGAWILLLFFLVPLVFHFFVAKGAKDKKSWARRASTGVGVLMLFGFPIGTLIGIYLLDNAWKDWVPSSSNDTVVDA